ncbi:MAG: T9SS type A sorting domain-containing protein [Melioribacteraceae bacterium]|nr:T9SS type A sorting domain-containing protein [Melioribacteraceae bacterium]
MWFDGYNENSAYYDWLTYSDLDSLFITDPDDPNVDDPVIIPAYPEQTIAPGDSLIYYVAIAYGVDEADMLISMQQAVDKYGLLTSVEDNQTLPSEFSLNQNYPNPFNPNTKISYQVPQKDLVTLKVYNVLGKEVTTLVNEEKPAGFYTIDFDASGLASGVYFYSIQYGSSIQTKKMTLLK